MLLLATAAPKVFFFVADPDHATYDLNARAPLSALYFQGYTETPYSDSFYYQFDLPDGADFFCHFIYADVGYGIKMYGLDYKLHYPNGKITYFGTNFGAGESSMAKDRFEWRLGPNRLTGDLASHRLHIESGPVKLDVTFKTVVPFYQVGQGGLISPDLAGKKSGRFTYFPLLTVSGSIKDAGNSINVVGWGYGNRTWQTFMITDLSSLHTALRWYQDGLGFDVHDYQLTPAYGGQRLQILMVHYQGKLVLVCQNYTKEILAYSTEPKSGKKIPASFRVRGQQGNTAVVIEFTNVKMSDRNDPLIILPPIARSVVQLISEAPLDIRLDGQVKITLTTPAGAVTRQGRGHGLALVTM